MTETEVFFPKMTDPELQPWKDRFDAVEILLGEIERRVDEEADDLAAGVHTRIGAPGNGCLHLPGDAEQGRLQVPLDGPHVVLAAVPVKVRAVVCEFDSVGRHR